MLSKLETRIVELTKAIEQSVCNHNALIGAFQEAKTIYDMAKAAESVLIHEDTVNNEDSAIQMPE